MVGSSSARKSSSRSKLRDRSLDRAAEIAAVRPALSMKWTTSSRRVADWAKVPSAFSLRPADRGVEVLRVGVQCRPELVDQELEAVLEGLAQRVLGKVGLNGRLVMRSGDWAVERLGRMARVAIEEVLGDQRLRLGG